MRDQNGDQIARSIVINVYVNRQEAITLYIQMELCKSTLEDFLTMDNVHIGRTEVQDRLGIAYQIVQALDVIHRQYGLVHRDITPKNIFFAQNGTIKIGDFGLAMICKHMSPEMPSPFVSASKRGSEIPLPALSLYEEGEGAEKECFPPHEDCADEDNKAEYGVGTKTYASPEQLAGSHYDQKVLETSKSNPYRPTCILLDLSSCSSSARATHRASASST